MERVKTNEDCDRSAKNLKFVDMVATKNVEQSINDIRNQSPILRNLEEEEKIMIVGAIYDHSTGEVHFC
jgi:carbonic anhydrase